MAATTIRGFVPEGDGWHKAPSVRTGGAPHFWARRNPATDQREWWLWINGAWTFQLDT